jgi:radical SAM superfamily enzyme YgiQ (UPF0313 family)
MQFGISYISSVLKSKGHNTKLLVLGSNNYRNSEKLLEEVIEEFSPRLICYTAVYSQYRFIEKIAQLAKKKWPDKYHVLGGVHSTLQTDEVMAGPFDAVCIGEGEYPMLEMCSQLESDIDPHGISNLWIRSSDGSVERNPTRNFVQDLDQLPFPDREMWKPWLNENTEGELVILCGRGCPYDCTYCSNHAIRKISNGKYVRLRSIENIVCEVSYLYENFSQRSIYFEIETISANKKWLFDLCDRLEEFNSKIDQPFSFGCNFRIVPNSIDESIFKALGKANFKIINIGLESGSEKIRREVLKRNYSNEDFLKVVSLARKYGIKVYVFNMIGLPDEKLEDHKETVWLNHQCQPDGHYTGIFYPYPGTELYNHCINRGYLKENLDIKLERRQPVIESPDFTKKEILKAYYLFNYHVYKGKKPIIEVIFRVLKVVVESNPATNFLFYFLIKIPFLKSIRSRFSRNL